MAISYPISLLAISAENTATTSNSLTTLSTTAIEAGNISTLNEAPYFMSEFNGYTHLIESAVAINGTSTVWGKGARARIGYTSGNDSYIGGAQGSISSGSPLSSSDGWGLSMSVQVAAWIEKANGAHHFAFEATSSSSTGANLTWWNKVTISRSGQTDVVLTRANTSKNEHSNYRMNIWWTDTTTNYIGNGLATWTFSSS